MTKAEEYYRKLKLESAQYGQGKEGTTDINNIKTMNRKTLEDVEEGIKNLPYNVGNKNSEAKWIDEKDVFELLKTLKL